MKQYVKKQGNFWVKTSEKTGWWIAGKRNVFIITNGFVCQYVRKELIKDVPIPQTEQQISNLNQASTTSEANSNTATQTQSKQISNLNQATTSTTTSNQTTSTSEANLTAKRKRGRPPAPQVICPKCGSSGIVIERLVKSYIYRYIRHKENGKIKECVIQNASKSYH
jgi:DNA-directed RNA polymerase subunit M/transcription elongation factor TFIIS